MSAIHEIPVNKITGEGSSLGEYKGDVLLIVNVASKCGLTPQYAGLEALNKKFGPSGLKVLGFPANDFAGQEPGSNTEIQTFCKSMFGVGFPMFEKVKVTGEEKHPLYKALIEAQPKAVNSTEKMTAGLIKFGVTPNTPPELLWNFEKFLVGRDGSVVARYSPDTQPEDPALVEAIEAELAKK